jgi:hypothetical protein
MIGIGLHLGEIAIKKGKKAKQARQAAEQQRMQEAVAEGVRQALAAERNAQEEQQGK